MKLNWMKKVKRNNFISGWLIIWCGFPLTYSCSDSYDKSESNNTNKLVEENQPEVTLYLLRDGVFMEAFEPLQIVTLSRQGAPNSNAYVEVKVDYSKTPKFVVDLQKIINLDSLEYGIYMPLAVVLIENKDSSKKTIAALGKNEGEFMIGYPTRVLHNPEIEKLIRDWIFKEIVDSSRAILKMPPIDIH